MEIRLLGPVEVRVGDDLVPVGAGKPRALLAMLALRAGEPVSSARLIEGLWEEGRAPASAPKNVQLYVSQLRKLGVEIATRGRGYQLDVEPDGVDALRFERLVAAGEARAALELWRGDPLDELAGEPFAAEAIRHLEDLRLDARELAIDQELDAGRHREVVSELDALVVAHPLRERLHAQRMLALYRSGRQADALAAFHQAREMLMDEIGIEPGRELRDLHERMLRQDPALDAPARVRRPAAVPSARAPRVLLVGGLAALALGAIAFGVSRVGGDSLDAIAGDSVGRVDPEDGRITDQYAVGHEPTAIAAGAGAIWIASGDDGTVSRVEADRAAVTTIDVGGEPTALAFGEDALWLADGETRSVVRIDPETNRAGDRITVGNAPRAIAVAHGAVWVASSIDDRVDRIDLETGKSRRLAVAGSPAGIAAGSDAVWVTSEVAGRVTRLDPRTGATINTVAVGSSPGPIAVNEDAVWVLNRADATLSRIDPAADAVNATVPVGGRPAALALGGGSLWVGDAEGGRLIRVDPGAAAVGDAVAVGGAPTALVVADAAVWTATAPPLASRRGGTLSYRIGDSSCGCFDPASYEATDWSLITAVFDGLTAYRRAGGSAGSVLVPNLAERLPEATDAGREYVFRLREGLRFSDGRPVRPSDFRASMERLVRIIPYGVEGLYDGIRGVAKCTPRACDLSAGIAVDDAARTITVRLEEPDAEFLHKLAIPLASMLPADSPDRLADEPLVGTGAYRVAEVDPARGGRLERTPGFESWSRDARPDGFPDAIEWKVSRDPDADVEAVRTGDADVVPVAGILSVAPSPEKLRALSRQEPSRMHPAAFAETDFVFLNTEEKPFDDVRVRRAVNYAIDRQRLVEPAGGDEAATVTCQIVPPGLPGYEPLCPYTAGGGRGGAWLAPDIATARRLVEASGTAGTQVTFATFRGPFQPAVEQAARATRRLGYPTRVRTFRSAERYFGHVTDARNRVQAGVTNWIADYLTASTFFRSSFTCSSRPPNGLNLSRFCDPEVDTAVDRALAHGGDEWSAVDQLVVEAAPAVPTLNRRSVVFVSERVGSIEQHPILGPLLDQAWVR